MPTKYDAESITWLKGAAAIRANPALYLGATDSTAIVHLIKEIVGNSIDEAVSGFGKTIVIFINTVYNTVYVADNGRGIPTGKHPKHPEYDTLTLLATELHTGGKSKNANDGYDLGTIGVHGLGLAVVNALSTKMTIYSIRGNKIYTQDFKRGVPVEVLPRRTKDVPEIAGYDPQDSGTVVEFTPDFKVFDKKSRIDDEMLVTWLRDLSWFVSNNEIKRGKIIKRTPVTFKLMFGKSYDKPYRTVTIKSPGLDGYFDTALKANKLEAVATTTPFVLQTDQVDVVLGWSSSDDDLLAGYTNGARNTNGGTHVKAFSEIIGRVFSKYAKKSDSYKVADLLTGAIGLVNVRMKAPKFNSQSKVMLISEEAKDVVTASFEAPFTKWAKQNQSIVKDIIQRAVAISKATNNLRNDRKLAAALKTKKGGKSIYPEGMLVSSTKNPEERELFLVEGQSAGGSAAKASDRRYQEVLCLTGKVANAMKGEEKAYKNKVVLNILRAIGYSPTDGTDKLRVGKIVILSDADPDGAHISSLLLALFYSIMPELFTQGKIYVADTPLYIYAHASGKKTYARSYDSLVSKLKDDGAKVDPARITRAKGLGEVDADVLGDVAFSPATRSLIRMGKEEIKHRLRNIMGDDVSYRKELLGLD